MSETYSINKFKFLTETELLDLKRSLARYNDRDSLLIQLALGTGARASELLGICMRDLDIEARTVLIKGLKGSNDREIPLTDELFNRLLLYSNEIEGRLFPISYRRLDQIWHDIRTCKKNFHSLRHTFAIELYKKTRDIRLVQVALGHKQISNTMVYAQYVYSKEELRRIIL
jgi:integrase